MPVGAFIKLFGDPFSVLLNWRKHLGWLFFFVGSPWLIFAGLWLLNFDYMMKFFQPVENDSWTGPIMLLIALGLGLLDVPLCGVHQRLLDLPNRNAYTIVRIVLTYLVATILWMASCSIILFTPAAFTMMEQMRNIH